MSDDLPNPPSLDWLMALVFSWGLPIALAQYGSYGYMLSLTFWMVPVLVLLRTFRRVAKPTPGSGVPYSRRRRAMAVTIAVIVLLGLVLDFLLGAAVLRFDRDTPRQYVFWIAGVPFEEILFYALAPTAILLVYVWCDEVWVPLRNPRPRLAAGEFIVHASSGLGIVALALTAAGVVIKSLLNRQGPVIPVYFCFLTAVAFVPAVFLYRCIHRTVNWPAFSITTLYVFATSAMWEATLAVPRRWWGYRREAALGIFVPDWARQLEWPFPLEAALVWLCAPFSCVLIYEAARAFYSSTDPSMPSRIHPSVERLAARFR